MNDKKNAFSWWLVALVALSVGLHGWIGQTFADDATTAEGRIYYPALADAFLAGQLHLKIDPDPRLKTLEKPWHIVPDGIPRLVEGTYFNDRYYLYFSPIPALVLFIPLRLLSGVFPTDHFSVIVFTLATWGASLVLYLWAWRRWFSNLSPAWLVLGLMLSAVCTRTLLILEEPMVHNVAVSCAALFGMLALLGVAWTVEQTRSGRQASGLALVSLLWAAAVGCRPNYLFGLPAVGILWIHLLRATPGGKGAWRTAFVRLTSCAFFPAALIGAGLLAYNYARFGQWLEFGSTNQIGSIDQSEVPVFLWSNLRINVPLFFLGYPLTPVFSAYFPFFPGWRSFWGILFGAPFVVLVLLLPVLLWRARWRQDRAWTTFMLMLAAGFLLNLLSIMLLTLLVGQAERYLVDFLPWGVLLSVFVGYALLEESRSAHPARWRRTAVVCLAVLFGAGLISSGLMVAVRSRPVERLPQLARAANSVVALVEHWRGVRYGPMTLRLRFHDFKVGDREPLLVSGHGRDIVYVEYLAPDQIRLGLDHRDSVPHYTDPIFIEAGREYHLDFDLGFLYPPPEHPFFAGYPPSAIHVLRHRLKISFGGTTELELGSVYHPSRPGDIFVGHGGPHLSRRFSGTVVAVVQHGLPRLETLTGPVTGRHVRLTVTLPPFRDPHNEPLLSLGVAGAGDLFYVRYLEPGKIRLGHDAYGSGVFESEPLDYVPETPVVIDMDIPSLRPNFTAGKPAPLTVRFGDRFAMLKPRAFSAVQPYQILAGFNGIDSSVVNPQFQGRILRLESWTEPLLPTLAQVEEGVGPLRLFLRLPAFSGPRSEPLLVTGETGGADAIYVEYLDAGHIRLGYDHWGSGGPVSPPLPVDYTATNVIELSLGSLYPPADDTAWGETPEHIRRAATRRVILRLNDRTVLAADGICHLISPGQVRIGRNLVGLSTCSPEFTGDIRAAERLPVWAPAFHYAPIEKDRGPVRLTLRLPEFTGPRSEPLLVTGETGGADAVYVQYLDAGHIRLGYDHWGNGGPVSPPLPVDYAATNVVELSLGSLYPPAHHAAWGDTPEHIRLAATRRVVLRLNDRTVLATDAICHPTRPDQVRVGRNLVGVSTCATEFTGEIRAAEHLPLGSPVFQPAASP